MSAQNQKQELHQAKTFEFLNYKAGLVQPAATPEQLAYEAFKNQRMAVHDAHVALGFKHCY